MLYRQNVHLHLINKVEEDEEGKDIHTLTRIA